MSAHNSLLFSLACAGLALNACSSTPAPVATTPVELPGMQKLPAEHVQHDVDLAVEILRSVHPGYDRYANSENPELLSERNAALSALRALENPTVYEFYGALSRYAASLRCGHTKTEFPEAVNEWRNSNPSHLPFRFVTDGQRMLVTTAAVLSGLSPGDEIVSIEGIAVPELVSRVGALTSVDGLTTDTRVALFEEDGDLLGSTLDHYLPVLFGPNTHAALELHRLGGDQATVRVPLVSFKEWRSLTESSYREDFKTAVHLAFPMPTIGVLTINTFVNYRDPIDPAAVFRSVVANARGNGVKTLIIDLRRNGGGSDGPVLALLRMLARERFQFMRSAVQTRLDYSDFGAHLKSWDPRALRPDPKTLRQLENGTFERIPGPDDIAFQWHDPVEHPFRGDVILLVGPHNSS
ncbi:MAG: S41 family peptidase, partial [Myxococcota bacterium]